MDISDISLAVEPKEHLHALAAQMIGQLTPGGGVLAEFRGIADAQNLMIAFSQTHVSQYVWDMILSGQLTPGSIPDYQPARYGNKKRTASTMQKFQADRTDTAERNVDRAQARCVAANEHLRVCKDKRDGAKAILNATLLVATIEAFAEHVAAVFAAGASWAVLLAIASIPKDLSTTDRKMEEAESDWLRGKLAAYIESQDFLDALRLNLLTFIRTFEADCSFGAFRVARECGVDIVREVFNQTSAAAFGTAPENISAQPALKPSGYFDVNDLPF